LTSALQNEEFYERAALVRDVFEKIYSLAFTKQKLLESSHLSTSFQAYPAQVQEDVIISFEFIEVSAAVLCFRLINTAN
jgi:hypothetical protein